MQLTYRDLSKMIDHSLLHPTMTDAQVRDGCQLARMYDVASACVKPADVPLAAKLVRGSDVLICAVAGFPHGNSHIDIKRAEAQRAIAEGATEIDVVVNLGKVLGERWDDVITEIKSLNDLCRQHDAKLKVIFENDFLGDAHIVRLCEICSQQEVAFVKTSTGYGFVKQPDGSYNYRGATEHHLRLMRQHSAAAVQIKAAGGIRTLGDLLAVRQLGVSRVGASATSAILAEAIANGYGPPPQAISALSDDDKLHSY